LFDGHRQDAEHEMAEHLGVTAHPYRPAAIAVLERTVDPFGAAALVIADILGRLIAGASLGQRLRLGFGLAATARIGIDDRYMPERAALVPNFRRVVSALSMRS
jgi:hypothetical protein